MTTDKNASFKARKVTTPEGRVSFPHVFKAKAAFEGQEPKFSMTLLFPKNADLKGMKQAVFNAASEKWGARDKWPKNLRLPFRDGDEKAELQGYPGTVFVNSSSKQKPGLVDGRLQPIEAESEFYAGCYARATLVAFAYDTAGNKGVSFALQNIQKLRDGDRFDGKRDAAQDFDAVEMPEDNPANYAGAEKAPSDDLGF